MTQDEAMTILDTLSERYRAEWEASTAETVMLWVEYLVNLASYPVGRETAAKLTASSDAMPSLAEFGEVYRSLGTGVRQPFSALDDDYANDPTTPEGWERKAAEHRAWRAEHYPGVSDPATDMPLPRTRDDFDREWGRWWSVHFGFTLPGSEAAQEVEA